MRVLFLARATLFRVFGGDTVQVLSTAKYLRKLGVEVDIKLANETIDYAPYSLLHLFNVIRPADFLFHTKASGKPYVISTIFVDYSEYQSKHAKGIVYLLNKYLDPDHIEYAKAIGRWIKNGETIVSTSYLTMGHRKSVKRLVSGAAYLLPNSSSEYRRFVNCYGLDRPHQVVYNGVDTELFSESVDTVLPKRDAHSVLCVSRIEGQKNQLNLIKALNNTQFRLTIIGKHAPNHARYYNACRDCAASNIVFAEFIPQEQLSQYYSGARVHVLPSWNETCGLSSLEAAFHNCNIVITDKGDTVEYYGTNAWYCDPGNPESIYKAIVGASEAPINQDLPEKIRITYNWNQAAVQTLSVYNNVLNE